MLRHWRTALSLLLIVPIAPAQETHDHPAPERLGKVSFPVSCSPAVQQQFNRGVALLHSFAYTPAQITFQDVARLDPNCAMAHWGAAMTYFHQLWDPPLSPNAILLAQKEIQLAKELRPTSKREQGFIDALDPIFEGPAIPYRTRAASYEKAMGNLAAQNPHDVEVQVFTLWPSSRTPRLPTRPTRIRSTQSRSSSRSNALYSRPPRNPPLPHPCL